MAGQNFAGPRDHRGRQSRQTGHFHPVAFVRAAGLYPPQEDDVAAGLANRDMHVLHPGKKLLQLGEFMVVSGEKRSRRPPECSASTTAQAIDNPS